MLIKQTKYLLSCWLNCRHMHSQILCKEHRTISYFHTYISQPKTEKAMVKIEWQFVSDNESFKISSREFTHACAHHGRHDAWRLASWLGTRKHRSHNPQNVKNNVNIKKIKGSHIPWKMMRQAQIHELNKSHLSTFAPNDAFCYISTAVMLLMERFVQIVST